MALLGNGKIKQLNVNLQANYPFSGAHTCNAIPTYGKKTSMKR